MAAISLHPNFILRLHVLSTIGDDGVNQQTVLRNNWKIAQMVEWAIKQSLENALIYPNTQEITLSPPPIIQ